MLCAFALTLYSNKVANGSFLTENAKTVVTKSPTEFTIVQNNAVNGFLWIGSQGSHMPKEGANGWISTSEINQV